MKKIIVGVFILAIANCLRADVIVTHAYLVFKSPGMTADLTAAGEANLHYDNGQAFRDTMSGNMTLFSLNSGMIGYVPWCTWNGAWSDNYDYPGTLGECYATTVVAQNAHTSSRKTPNGAAPHHHHCRLPAALWHVPRIRPMVAAALLVGVRSPRWC